MSVIAWDGSHIVSDNQVTCGNEPKRCQKLFSFVRAKIRHGIGYVGCADEGIALVAWYKAGADFSCIPDYPDTDILVATGTWCISITGGDAAAVPILEPYTAVGSGQDFAMSALALGLNARQAVAHAIKHDIYCGYGTRSIKLR